MAVETDPVVSPYRMGRSRREYSATADTAKKRGTSRSAALPGWRRKPADEDLLRFVTLHGVVALRQAARWFYGGKTNTASYRVRLLAEAGLLRRHNTGSWAGVVLVPTLDGQTVGIESAAFPVSHSPLRGHMSVPANLLHRLLVAEHALASRAAGRRVISERQLRMLDARGEDETKQFLQHEGVVYSHDGYTPGVRPSEVTITTEHDGRTVTDGVRNTWLAVPVRTTFDDRAAPLSQQRSGIRYPDYIEVTEQGELVAVEVEITTKSADRVRRLVDGYVRSLPAPETYTKPDGTAGQRIRRRQFRQCRWIVSPYVGHLLRGHTDLVTGEHTRGMVQQLMPRVFPDAYDWHNQQRGRPVIVDDADSAEPFLQYALDQGILEPRYQCDYPTWRRWRRLWRDDIPEDQRHMMTFTRWLRAPGKLAACHTATRS